MIRPTLIRVIVLSSLYLLVSSQVPLAKKTKLCGDESCSEKLFDGTFHRKVDYNHESFLKPEIDDVVSVYAIKFSDRPDLLEGALTREPTKRGSFFSLHIDQGGYVDFLKNAIVNNKTLFVISREPGDQLAKKLVGTKSALPELIKDYEVNSERLAREKNLPPPEPLDYGALGYHPEIKGHGHTHGGSNLFGHISDSAHEGHGHTHNANEDHHGHSHGEETGHGHQHSHEHAEVPLNPATQSKVEERLNSIKIRIPLSTDKEEVTTDIVEEDGLGYCIKGDCDKIYTDPGLPIVDEVRNFGRSKSTFGKMLSKLISLFRYALPPPIDTIDDAGVVVTLFVPICILIHLIRIFICSDSSEQESFDRRTFHDALTAVRERDEQIKKLRVEAERGRGLASKGLEEKVEQLEMEVGQKRLEIQQLKNKCSLLEDEQEKLKLEIEEAKERSDNERQKAAKLNDEKRQLERSSQMFSDQIAEMQLTMENAREKSATLEDELSDKNALIARQESEIRSHNLEIKKLNDQLKTALDESRVLAERVEALQNESVQLSVMIEEMDKKQRSSEQRTTIAVAQSQEEPAAQESGGSGGWSDIEDFDIDSPAVTEEKSETKKKDPVTQEARRESPSHYTDIVEVARLRAQLKRVEADLDQAKLALQKEENVREHLTRKLELAELEASEKKKESEAKEEERIDTHNQCKKMLSMVEERDAKIRHTEEVIEKLRDEVSKWQVELRHIEEQKKLVEAKLNEAEQELKKMRTENNRLETKHFHELRECRQTIAALQQSLGPSQLSAKPAVPVDTGNLLNLSSSSEREYGSLAPRLVAPPLPVIRPLWGDDDPVEVYSVGESSLMAGPGVPLRGRGASSPDDSNGLANKKASRARRGNREQRDLYADDPLPRPKKEGRRMRSRSHGRHPFASAADYMPPMGMPPSFIDMFDEPPIHKRNSKSGNLYYSSGGSNGGLSPPPEMALLSGVPPPSLSIKKPMATSRPKSAADQATRHQS